MIKKFIFGVLGFTFAYSLYLNLAWAYIIGKSDRDKVIEMLESFRVKV